MNNGVNAGQVLNACENGKAPAQSSVWKIIIADEKTESRQRLKSALEGAVFQGKGVEFLYVFDFGHAKRALSENPDTALIVADVPAGQETAAAGFAKAVREKAQNGSVRLVFKTQSDDAAFRLEAVEKYGVDECCPESELNGGRLPVVVAASLRIRSELMALEYSLYEKNKELQKRECLLQAVSDASLTPTAIVKACDGEVVFVNRKGAELYGKSVREVLGRRDYINFPDVEAKKEMFSTLMRTGRAADTEIRVEIGGKDAFWALVSAAQIPYENEACLLFDFVDISKRKALEERLTTSAATDALTGVPNRAAFSDFARKEVARALRKRTSFGILALDLDRFKNVNDTFGHAAGDAVLKTLAGTFVKALRPTDGFARLGGEEFAALLPETDTVTLTVVAERLRMAAEKTLIPLRNTEIRVTVSIGAAVFNPDGGETVEEVLARADKALYRSKEAGRNRVTMSAASAV